MSDSINFMPSDLESVVTVGELTDILTQMIIEIRALNPSSENLRNKISALSQSVKNGPLNKDSSTVSELYDSYEMVQSISMELRALLSKFINLEVYDSIGYSFYYNGRRYVTDTIKPEWLMKGSKGELRLNLEAATQDLKQDYGSAIVEAAQDVFQEHYISYLNAISGTYQGYIGRGALNKGHIAEAYEEHIQEHHRSSTQLFDDIYKGHWTVMDKALMAFENDDINGNYWSQHEDIQTAWMHVRHALGTQRGTVAGDVGRLQVKSGSDANEWAPQVRLASLKTLQDGINYYSAILSDENPDSVARRIAIYMSEPVRNVSAKLLNNITDEEAEKVLEQTNIYKTVKDISNKLIKI